MGQISLYKRASRPLVYVMYTHKRKSVLFSTGVSVEDRHWDFGKKKLKMFDPMFDLLQAQMDETVLRVRAVVHEVIITHLDPEVHRVKEMYQRSLNQSGKGYKQMKAEYLSERKVRFTEGTLKNDIRFFNKVSQWRGTINVEDFRKSDIDDFSHWLYSLGLYNNTITRYMVTLKTFMKWGYEKGYHHNLEWKKIKTSYEVNNVVFMTRAEYEAFRVVRIPEWMEKYRDIYLFMVYTGMSIGDAMRFRKSMVLDGFIIYNRQKSGTEAYVPYSDDIDRIMRRYDGQLPMVSEQKINKNIKRIAKMAGMTQLIEVKKKRRDKTIRERVPKWKKITTHTARKTFVTMCMQKNITEGLIMQMGGYLDSNSLRSYKGIDLQHIRDQYNGLF